MSGTLSADTVNFAGFYTFLSHVSTLTRDIDIAILSVSPFVRPSHAGIR